MSNLETSNRPKQSLSPRNRKKIQVDFTPLVDLGFLLITFFMLTTSMVRPKSMEIIKPKPIKDANPIKASQALSIFLTKNDKIGYYFGLPNENEDLNVLQFTDFSQNGIRKILQKANRERNPLVDSIQIYKNLARNNKISVLSYQAYRKRIESKFADKALIVLIKVEDRSKYQNLVDILDEMSINNIRTYALVDITPAEVKMVKSQLP